MPGYICSVAICKSNSEHAKNDGEKISFHSFPTDKKHEKEWIRRCHRKDKFDPKHKRICSKHFLNEDYEDAVQAKLMGVMPKRLKKQAVPSVNLLPNDQSSEPSKREHRVQEKERIKVVKKILEESQITTSILTRETVQDLPGSSSESDHEKLQRLYDNLLAEHNEAKKQIENYKAVISESNLRNSVLQKDNEEIEKKINLYVNNTLSEFLTPNQIQVLRNKKKKPRWNEEEISKAFTLRYFGKRGYIYVKQKLKYPLPGISTLQRWASNLDLRNGMLKDMLRIMDTCGQSKTQMQRLTVLSFDEVKVCSTYEYDQKRDEIVGEHKYMQVVMARGLCDPWKQPVFIDFDTKITKAILDELLFELGKINYIVVACVSDCGGGNMGLWKELYIDITKTYYLNPISNEKIYFLADVPHLLKLIRNWLIDSGFKLKDGTIITKKPIQALIESTTFEISSCHKLSVNHITCEKTQRQNVAMAAQIFSNTTATALKRYLPGEDKKSAEDVSNFVELIATWFDIFNSYVPYASVPTRSAYGLNRLEEQNDILNKVKDTVLTMRCCNKTALQIFQKGVYISTSSLQSLFQDLSAKYEIKYILTHRLNQDCLENMFSQIRTRGGLHDHPSPLNALYRIRMILLGKNPGLVQKRTNVDIEENEFLVSTAIKRAHIKCDIVDPALQETLGGDNSSHGSSITLSSSSSSSIDQSPGSSTMTEKDGLEYIAGYLAKKYREKHPTLGKYTYETNQMTNLNLHTYSMPSWVQQLSFGGLTEPSENWTKQVLVMEGYFKKYHKETFSCRKNIIEQTSAYISKQVKDVPADLVNAFARQRIFVRIKYLNEKKKASASVKRKNNEDLSSEQRKMAKKIRKTTN